MNTPLNIARFIALSSEKPLELAVAKRWFQTVTKLLPSGLTLAVQSTDNTGYPRTVSMVHRESSNGNSYIVPLTRDLTEDEAQAVVEEFSSEFPEEDFDIRVSASSPKRLEQQLPEVTLDRDRYLAMCTSWAKRQHEEWLTDRTSNGWRYGTTFNIKQKTHPLLQPWAQLPAKYQNIDLDSPQKLLDLLNDQGYTLVSRGELDAILKLIRNFL